MNDAEETFTTLISPPQCRRSDVALALTPPPAGLRDQAAVLLAGALKVVVIAAAALLIVTPVGESPGELLKRAGLWGGGWSLGEVKVHPRAVLEAVVVLVGGLLAVAVLKRWLAMRYLPTTALDKPILWPETAADHPQDTTAENM